jgi:CTP synthase
MRLGSYACKLTPGSKAHALYGADVIEERHRHRYEFNCLYEKALTDKGWRSSAARSTASSSRSSSCRRTPYYVAVQFHPEFKSKPLKPHPLFAGFVAASHRTSSRRGSRRRRPW